MQFSPKRANRFALSLVALGLGMTAPVYAQNLVKDGGFEQADPSAAPGAENSFTPISPFDQNWVITQGRADVDTQNLFVYDGNKSLYLNAAPSGMTTTIAQNLATTPGQIYTLSFYADQSEGSASALTVAFGGITLGSAVVPAKDYAGPPPGNNGRFTFYSGTVTATSAISSLTFSASTPPDLGGLTVDDISVTPAVPEASTTVSFGLMLALGMGGFVVAARKKKAKA